VQRPLAARFDGEVAGGAVADSFFVIFRFGATMELGRSGRSMMMMTSASASGGDGGVAGSLSAVQRPTGSSMNGTRVQVTLLLKPGVTVEVSTPEQANDAARDSDLRGAEVGTATNDKSSQVGSEDSGQLRSTRIQQYRM
jgi:hypothetical protein